MERYYDQLLICHFLATLMSRYMGQLLALFYFIQCFQQPFKEASSSLFSMLFHSTVLKQHHN